MPQTPLTLTVRPIDETTSIIGMLGELTMFAEEALTAAYTQASGPATRIIVVDFNGVEYMNSGGVGLVVMLLVRMRRQGQQLLAFGLSAHNRRIFELSRLNEIIQLYDGEAEALAAAHGA
jgi:anti-sigma B factor antagonist